MKSAERIQNISQAIKAIVYLTHQYMKIILVPLMMEIRVEIAQITVLMIMEVVIIIVLMAATMEIALIMVVKAV